MSDHITGIVMDFGDRDGMLAAINMHIDQRIAQARQEAYKKAARVADGFCDAEIADAIRALATEPASRAMLPVTDSQPEPAPNNSLPNWSECNRIIENHEFRQRAIAGLEGQVLDTPPPPAPTELHRFIYEYDDADAYRSAWFLHRLELVIEEVKRASPVAGWVSVEDERKPAEHEVVAVIGPAYGSFDKGRYVSSATYYNGEFFTEDGDQMHPPSHWQHLPPAPVTPKQEQS